jgi:DNA-binding NarL/FixJ family response regulator
MVGEPSLAVELCQSAACHPLGVMDEHPVYVRLTAEQVASIVHAAQGGSAASLAALLSGRVAREGMPPIEVWEERAQGETVESRFSFSLVRGLLLLARLADGQPARLKDLAAELNLSASTVHTYVRTLLMAGLVRQDPETRLYRLAE